MQKKMTVLFLAAASLCALPARPDAVDDAVRAAMERQGIPGLALAIVQGGRIMKAQGYGFANVELDVPVTPDTIFQSASVGKQFTAAGILLLAEDGKLRLDDPLSLHFPSAPSAWHRIRIRHLLTHTSGLKDYGSDEVDLRRDYTEDDLLKMAMGVPVEFEPGTQWSYSNTGYMVLGILVSKLAGRHWSEFLRERVFVPAGMETTRVISEVDIVKHRAAGYERTEDGKLRNQDWVNPSLNRLGDGALYFNVKDLAAWDRTLRRRGLLSAESYEKWWTPVSLGSGITYPYGFGWDLEEQRGRRLIEHGGSWQGFRLSISRYVDDDLSVAVLTNAADAQPEAIGHAVAGLVVEGLRPPDLEAPASDPDPARTARLKSVLQAWAEARVIPEMGRGLAATASGSGREADGRRTTGERLAQATRFVWLADDDLAARPLDRHGEAVVRIAYCLLETPKERFAYRFHLTADGRVADFSAEPR